MWNISQSCFVGALWAPSALGGDARNLWIMPPRKTITMITGMFSSVDCVDKAKDKILYEACKLM